MTIEKPLMGDSANVKLTKRRGIYVLLDFVPILEWLPHYDFKECFFPDLSGAITLGNILICQSLAHAKLCGVTFITGPYSCMLGPAVYAIFGTCIHSSIGTGALICLMTADVLKLVGETEAERTARAGLLTFLVGAILALMGLLRMASFVRFLSRPALSGFITAGSLLAMLSQAEGMLGLPKLAKPNDSIQGLLMHNPMLLKETKWPTLVLSVVALLYLTNAKKLKKIKLLKPFGDFKELVLLGTYAIFSAYWNAAVGDSLHVAVVGDIPSGLPRLSNPFTQAAASGTLIREMLPGAFFIALVAFLTSFAGAKKFGLEDGYKIEPTNELVGIGMTNVAGAFLGAVPTSIGNTRMGIARQCGVRTQLGANVFVSIYVGFAVAFLTKLLYNIPLCSLNAIIVVGSSHMMEFSHAKELYQFSKIKELNWKTRMDIIVWMVGFFGTMQLGASDGIALACVVSLFIIVYQVVNPEIQALGFQHDVAANSRRWKSLPRANHVEVPGIIVYRLEGPCFYANVEQMIEWLENEELKRMEEDPNYELKAIIFSAIAVPFMDTTAAQSIERCIKTYRDRNVLFFIANTFGQTGRLVTMQIEDKEARGDAKLEAKIKTCSSIDDFVELVQEHFKARKGTKRFGRMSSIMTPLRDGAGSDAV
eukprot:TRINITY_DN14983_c0_g1_i2.p1 TRINITY_DN14983_c0_g1~~TRINITY_DN14983_c0_g1_i2.p1  ORF type:complete len:650 (+),score=91.72 TRINITY_DN14983_c0_g1_i2:301-2250(+)